MNQTTFQLYLLSKMRATSKVDEALRRLGFSRQDASRAADEAILDGFDEIVHSAQLYRQALGEPYASELERSLGVDSPFAGSAILRFKLPVWPDFDFVVREHPAGYAWGMGFQRAPNSAAPPLQSAADLSPWAYVQDEVAARLGPLKSEDAWSGWEDLSCTVAEPGGRQKSYLLGFDMNLLQTIL